MFSNLLEEEVSHVLRPIATKDAPKGFKWIFCRYRRVRNSQKVLDAHEYGYEAWAFLVRA